ncbi:MAG: DUF2203 domain-containing protein [Planctomycetota bacterium]
MTLKVFTPLEATRTLPLVRRIVHDVLQRGQELTKAGPSPARQQELVTELDELFAELEQIGCTFRCPNFEVGLVDFPGVIEGQLVHLCWRDDEVDLRYYHAPEAGFAGRKLIPAELLAPQRVS